MSVARNHSAFRKVEPEALLRCFEIRRVIVSETLTAPEAAEQPRAVSQLADRYDHLERASAHAQRSWRDTVDDHADLVATPNVILGRRDPLVF